MLTFHAHLQADDFGASPERSPTGSPTAVAPNLSLGPAVPGGASALQLHGLVAMQEDVIQQSKAENIDAQRVGVQGSVLLVEERSMIYREIFCLIEQELEHLRRLHSQHHSTATEIALINR